MLIMYRKRCREQGFTLVWALFLIVIGALISIFMVRMSTVQSATNDLSLNGARAWQAARAGSEWGIHQAATGSCIATSSFSLVEVDLAGFNVTVNCTRTTHMESGNTINRYEILSSASRGSYGSSPDYVYRQVQASVAL